MHTIRTTGCFWAENYDCALSHTATGLRRSLRVQLKRERQILCAGCHGCDQSPSFRHQSSRSSQEKNTAVVALPPQKRKLKDFDLSLIVEENNGDLAEMLHFVQCELQGAEERADSAEKVSSCLDVYLKIQCFVLQAAQYK